ncbi:MAG: FMN-binding protein [Clostridia bacterium]|nr:FMN-binding protein [Clostridia bacterium]
MQNKDNSKKLARRAIKRVRSDALENKSELEKIKITDSEPVTDIEIDSPDTGFKITDAPTVKEEAVTEVPVAEEPAVEETVTAVEEPVVEVPAAEEAPAEVPDEKAVPEEAPSAEEVPAEELAAEETPDAVPAEEIPAEADNAPAEAEEVPAEIPAPESAEDPDELGKVKVGPMLKTGAMLLAVCAIVTLVLAMVNFLTKDMAAANKQKDTDIAIKELFPTCTASTEEETVHGAPINGVYKVMEKDTHIGYAVGVIASGFGGDIEMLVGIGHGGVVNGVKIISMSETPNVGSRVNDSEYLSGYKGLSGELVIGQDVDAISGATVSSKAVLAGVNAVLALDLKVEGVATEDSSSEAVSTDEVTIDVSTPIPPDEGLETVPVTGETPSLGFDTLYRDETIPPIPERDETSIIEIVTQPDAETTVPTETDAPSGDSGAATDEPVSSDTAPVSDAEAPAA